MKRFMQTHHGHEILAFRKMPEREGHLSSGVIVVWLPHNDHHPYAVWWLCAQDEGGEEMSLHQTCHQGTYLATEAEAMKEFYRRVDNGKG